MKKNDFVRTVLKVVFVLLLFYMVCYYETHYTRDCQVISVYNDTITCEDKQGHRWEFYGDNFKVGQVIRLTFFTHNTNNIYDDEIINAK